MRLSGQADGGTPTRPWRHWELKESVASAGATLLARAREAEVVRPDLAAADLVPLMCGIAHAVSVHGGSPADRVDTAHRYLAALLEGLRTTPPSAGATRPTPSG
ncbi:hypothetical protein [Streptomyces longwoodensis]|uniref:SbtR family transcriptional regulator n=1 Tax=Streptomyces longwoodensis TaxID=68231 RepID=UPI0033F9BF51